MATRTMGVASKLSGVKGEQAGVDDSVADFRTWSSRPPIPDGKDRSVALAGLAGLAGMVDNRGTFREKTQLIHNNI